MSVTSDKYKYAVCLETNSEIDKAIEVTQNTIQLANENNLETMAISAQALLASLEFRANQKTKLQTFVSFAKLLKNPNKDIVVDADIRYRKWLIDSENSEIQNEARAAYRQLLSSHPSHLSLSRYAELIGKPIDKSVYLATPTIISNDIKSNTTNDAALAELAFYALNRYSIPE